DRPVNHEEVQTDDDEDDALPPAGWRSIAEAAHLPNLPPSAVERDPERVPEPEEDERPSGAVPYADQQEGEEEVRVRARRAPVAAAERDVDVVLDPARQRDV